MIRIRADRARARAIVLSMVVSIVSGAAAMVAHAAATIVVCPAAGPGCDHTDLAAAVAAASPGDRIEMRAGVYAPAASVVVNKSLTIAGPQEGVDPRPGIFSARTPGAANEAILDGNGSVGLLRFEAANVVVDGLEVRNGVTDMIKSNPGGGAADVTLRNLIVHGSTSDEGIQLKDCANCTIERTYSFDNTGDGISLADGSTGTIRNNEVHGNGSSHGQIYVYGVGAAGVTVDRNLIRDDGLGMRVRCILTEACAGPVNVTRNTFRDLPDYGIRVQTEAADITLSENLFHGNMGTAVIVQETSNAGNNVFANQNELVGNAFGMTYTVPGTYAGPDLDAENNWWGSASGPFHLASAPATGTGDQVGDRIDFDPWLGAGIASGTVDCDDESNDIAALQQDVNAAADGDTIFLLGTCDFSAAAPHGGDTTSIAATAVSIRPGAPIDGLTITSLNTNDRARIIGSGTQTAFFVAPGNKGVRITDVEFANLARPIVVWNAQNTTIGSDAGSVAPDPDGNRIIGSGSMNSAILALANSTGGNVTVSHGRADAPVPVAYSTAGPNAVLTGLRVLGNYISYDPPGHPTPSTDVIAIDVRQRNAGNASDIDIRYNAVGMFASEFPNFNQNGVRVHAHSGDPNYHIDDVEVISNNLGRLEEADAIPGAGDVHATGRAGIVLVRVEDFLVEGNGVRTRISPTGFPMPGGGIIASDSSDGTIRGNGVIVVADPSTIDSDLGAIGVFDDVNNLFGPSGAGPDAERVIVRNNTIGPVTNNTPGLGAQRALVLNGVSQAVVTGNNVKFATGPAISLGVEAAGPGAIGGTGATLQGTVEDSVVCLNTLEGTLDDDGNVEADAVSSNAFPGGSGVATDNTECTPTLMLSPLTLNASTGDLDATGTAWPNRPVQVTLTDAALGTRSASTTAAADGAFTVSFPATGAGWGGLADGDIDGVATASDTPSGISADSAVATVVKDTLGPPAPTIVNPADGSFVPPSFNVNGTGPANHTLRLEHAGTPIATTTVNGAGNWSIALTGQAGTLALRAFAVDGALNDSAPSNLVNLTIDASVPAPPVIVVPFEGEVVPTNAVSISGTAAPNHTIEVRKLSPAPTVLLGTTVSDGAGAWSIGSVLADGLYRVSAIAINGVNTPSAPAVRNFRVNTDFVAPLPPTIITPPSGSLQPTLVTISGEAEIGAQVTVEEGATVVGRTKTKADGTWSLQTLMAAGPHTITAYATDAGGNDSADTPARSFRVDGQRPRVTITTSDLTPFIGAPVIEGSASDDSGVAAVEVEVLSATGQRVFAGQATLLAPNNNQSLWSIETPGIGTGIFTVRAASVDVAGNRSPADSTRIIVVRG